MRFEELDYKICKKIKYYKETFKVDPSINEISYLIEYSNEATRYHLKKLEKIGIIEKTEDKGYILKVNTLK